MELGKINEYKNKLTILLSQWIMDFFMKGFVILAVNITVKM
jgi:hypothetical protein